MLRPTHRSAAACVGPQERLPVRTFCRLSLFALLICAALPVSLRAQDEGPLPALENQNHAHGSQADSADTYTSPAHRDPQVLDNAAVIRMTKADIGDSIIRQAISTQPVNFQTGPDDLIALKNAGVSQSIISAMLARSSGLSQRPIFRRLGPTPLGSSRAVLNAPIEVTPLSPDVDDPGLYFKNKQGQWEAVSPELITYRDGGALKSLITNNIVKKDLNGQINGPKSSLQIEPGTEMLILAPRLCDPVEYVILRFRDKSDRREFRVRTGNVFHSETGAGHDQLEIPIHKVSPRIFSFTVPADIAKGEFGVLPPGNANASGMVYAGKMYTFRVNN